MADQQKADDEKIDERVYQHNNDGTGIQMSEEEHTLYEAFNLFDQDSNGTISRSEFYKLMCALGFNPTEEEVKTTVEKLDKDNSGRIEFNEFREFYKVNKEKLKNTTDEIVKAFKVFDKDNNGYIEAKEIKHIIHGIGQTYVSDSQIEEMISVVDTNKDGKINYHEFAKFINKPFK